ncbi:MAG: alpha-mannosidase, partial [bacterium]|nr:alpha-mannosidase [bacterium]
MSQKLLHLVCNAHLDPVWLWEWEEGLAETLSTFRTAAKFCEDFEGFVFCHNESLLYEWIEEYEPALFERIQQLVIEGKWRIIGGWYVQPDCNLPSGESFVRQILIGKTYFRDKFNFEPGVAINFDPFGHTRGLVQILKKAGYDGYLFCRPDEISLKLPENTFIWEGYDGSKLLAHRAADHYNSERGKAGDRIAAWIEKHQHEAAGILLWGIGNHGGGPSEIDLVKIAELQANQENWEIRHSAPEPYFDQLSRGSQQHPHHPKDINPWAVGCYTTMSLVKQKHRALENRYFLTEKMVTQAALQGLMEYPGLQLNDALKDLLFCQFHDILPGSATSENENYALQRMDHGLEILSRLKSRAFFAFLAGQKPAAEGEFPLFVYNPHSTDIEETIVVEFQPPEPNFNWSIFWRPEIFDEQGNSIPVQVEKESSNIQIDHRKRVVFKANLKAATMNRFSCYLRDEKIQPLAKIDAAAPADYIFSNNKCELRINRSTGLIDKYLVDGIDFLEPGAFKLLVIEDYPDPWGMSVRGFRNVKGEFSLLTPEEAAQFAGVSINELPPVRVIENGSIRTIVEALFG